MFSISQILIDNSSRSLDISALDEEVNRDPRKHDNKIQRKVTTLYDRGTGL